jgi:hypothetical protein
MLAALAKLSTSCAVFLVAAVNMDIASILAAGKANVLQLIVRQFQKRVAVPALGYLARKQMYKA